jgi:hypothetical protein
MDGFHKLTAEPGGTSARAATALIDSCCKVGYISLYYEVQGRCLFPIPFKQAQLELILVY